MIQYAPWSKIAVDRAIELVIEGRYNALDIELSGKCPYNCLYCETPFRDRKSRVDFDKICDFLNSKKFEWVYICGIGEPTFECNEEHLLKILECCKQNNVKCSIFTNLSNLSERLKEYIKAEILYIIFKFDSLSENVLREVYNPSDVNSHQNNINKICELINYKDNITNIAASIVPTQYNLNEVPKLFKWCLERNIYPLVGQLENSGSAKDVYNKLYLTDSELKTLKKDIEVALGEEYIISFCPAVISGFHISNEGQITLDRRTGLSCHWFWLDEPNVEEVCRIEEVSDIDEITKKVQKIRKRRFDSFRINRIKYKSDILGGCGGNKKEIFDVYEKIMERLYPHNPHDNYLKINRFTYLDNNATTKISESVRKAMMPYWDNQYGNPSSNSSLGREAKNKIEEVRKQIASVIEADANEIYFTSGGSESNSWAIYSALKDPKNKNKKVILTTATEHSSVLDRLELEKKEYKIVEIPILTNGSVDVSSVSQLVAKHKDNIALCSIILVNNEIGVINNVGEIAKILLNDNISIHCDAIAAFGKININVQELGIDYLSISGHKIHAPKGIGALFIKKTAYIHPLICGHQENNWRGGTENVAFIVALGHATLDAYASKGMDHFKNRIIAIEDLRNRIEDELSSIEGIIINGKEGKRVANVSNIGFKDIDAVRLSLNLEQRGIFVSNGAACNVTNPKYSHVLKAMKSTAFENGAIRISLSNDTTDRDIEYFIVNLREAINKLKGEK